MLAFAQLVPGGCNGDQAPGERKRILKFAELLP